MQGLASAEITVTQWDLRTRVGVDPAPSTWGYDTTVALPFDQTRVVTDGASTATTTPFIRLN